MSLSPILVQPKRLALLAYLTLAAPGRFVRRDILLPMFWPDLDDAHARNALNKAVHHLRRALGEEMLLSRGDAELRIAEDRIECDALEFDHACTRQDWDVAVGWYRGSFLHGLHLPDSYGFGEWLERERARLRRQGAQAAGQSAEQHAVAGRNAEAIAAARVAVELAPDDEPAVRRLMELLEQHGDRAGALSIYEEFAAWLHREFSAEPDAATQALRRSIAASVDPVPPGPASTASPVPDRDNMRTPELPAALAPTGTRRPRTPRMAWAALAVVLVMLVLGITRRGVSDETLPVSGNGLAVFPFAPSSPDTALTRFGRDLMVLVSTQLNGIGGVEVVDPIAVLAHVDAESGSSSTDRAEANLRLFGAVRVVKGTLIRQGNGIRVDGGLFPADGLRPLARISVTMDTERVGAMADSIVLQVVKQIWQSTASGGAEVPPLVTRSLPALRAFLDGERQFAAGSYHEAQLGYGRAIDADSTFWLASWRYMTLLEFVGQHAGRSIAENLRAHQDQLPEPQRSLLAAHLMDTAAVRTRLLANATLRYPLSWEAWYWYGDDLAHWGPFSGKTRNEARGAFERSVALNPGIANAWEHLLDLGLINGDTIATARALRELEQLQSTAKPNTGGGYSRLLEYRWIDARLRGDESLQGILLDSLASALVHRHGRFPTYAFDIVPLKYGLGEAQIQLSGRVLALSPGRALADGQTRGIALAWAARGAWDSALATMDLHVAAAPVGRAPIFRYQLAVIGAWVGALTPADAAARRPVAGAIPVELTWAPAEIGWLDGLLAAVERDPEGLVEAQRRIRTGIGPMAEWLDSSMAALGLELRGEHAAAIRKLTAVEEARFMTHPFYPENGFHPFLTAVNRMVLARGLVQVGDTVEALRQLRWAEAFSPTSNSGKARAVMTGLVELERARLEAATGQSDLARIHYWQFLRRYDMPMPVHQHLVEEARAALERVGTIACPEADSACGASK